MEPRSSANLPTDKDDNNGDILQYANSLKKYKYGEADENGYESYDDDEDDEEDAEGIFVDAKEYITDWNDRIILI